jgi:MerR family transcriptional regulator, aldehyde-responsive regulator
MTIAEAGEQLKISPDTLRYYEKIGLIPPVKRNRGGIRDYGETDLNWVEFIKLMRGAGLPIEVLSEYVRLAMQGDETVGARKEILVEQRKKLRVRMAEMKKTIDRLNYKIEQYEDTLSKKENKLIASSR